jgi:hypothetical protein
MNTYMKEYEIRWQKYVDVCTAGARAIFRNIAWMVAISKLWYHLA